MQADALQSQIGWGGSLRQAQAQQDAWRWAGFDPRLIDAERRHHYRLHGAEAALGAVEGLGVERCATGDADRIALMRTETELDQGHGRQRTQVMRQEGIDERVGDFRKAVFELLADASGEESGALQQALDVGIGPRFREVAPRIGMGVREDAAGFPQKG